MKLFEYNEKSILDNGFARTVNGVVMAFFLIIISSNSSGISTPHWTFPTISLLSALSTAFFVGHVEKKTEFYEWDYTERQKKRRFLSKYATISVFLSILFFDSILMAYLLYREYGLEDSSIAIIALFPPIILAFNLCNIGSLYHMFFKEEIELSYKIQKKPDNWQDNGKEIKNSDEVKEIIQRDFGIRI